MLMLKDRVNDTWYGMCSLEIPHSTSFRHVQRRPQPGSDIITMVMLHWQSLERFEYFSRNNLGC